MTERRFLVSPEALEAGSGASVLLDGDEHHHLTRVLRLRPEDVVWVFDGAGRGFRGSIESIGRDSTRVRLESPDDRRVDPVFQVTLAQGVPHHDKMDLVVQKATELGVACIVPILTERTVMAFPAGRSARLERWRRMAREAARQSGRLRVPAVEEPQEWSRFVRSATSRDSRDRFLLVADPTPGAGWPRRGSAGDSAVVAVGAEGGWSESEVADGLEHGYSRVGLGPRVLRTETAGIVAVALALYLAGELGGTQAER